MASTQGLERAVRCCHVSLPLLSLRLAEEDLAGVAGVAQQQYKGVGSTAAAFQRDVGSLADAAER